MISIFWINRTSFRAEWADNSYVGKLYRDRDLECWKLHFRNRGKGGRSPLNVGELVNLQIVLGASKTRKALREKIDAYIANQGVKQCS